MPYSTKERLKGSCLCGGIQYEVDPTSISPQQAHCHCVDCRKHCGAAFSTYGETNQIYFTRGKDLLNDFRSSNGAVRQFCRVCGSSLTFKGANQDTTIEFSLATLDMPHSSCQPDAHVFYRSKVPWIESTQNDGLPKHIRSRNSKLMEAKEELPLSRNPNMSSLGDNNPTDLIRKIQKKLEATKKQRTEIDNTMKQICDLHLGKSSTDTPTGEIQQVAKTRRKADP